jgi:hypothetical protein
MLEMMQFAREQRDALRVNGKRRAILGLVNGAKTTR